jgi:hypothetical protein
VTAQVKREAGSTRNAIRWGVLLAAVGTIGFRLPRLVHEFGEWRAAVSSSDSSTADAWRISLLADLIGVMVVLAVGMVVFYVMRPRPNA